MRVVGVVCAVLAVGAAAYEYAKLHSAAKQGGQAALPRHLATAPGWAQWLSRREAWFRACTLACIGVMVGFGSFAPTARGFDPAKAGVGTQTVLVVAALALLGMFLSMLAKKMASSLGKPDSALVARVTNVDHRR